MESHSLLHHSVMIHHSAMVHPVMNHDTQASFINHQTVKPFQYEPNYQPMSDTHSAPLNPISAYGTVTGDVHYNPITHSGSGSVSYEHPVGNGCRIVGSVTDTAYRGGNNPGGSVSLQCTG